MNRRDLFSAIIKVLFGSVQSPCLAIAPDWGCDATTLHIKVTPRGTRGLCFQYVVNPTNAMQGPVFTADVVRGDWLKMIPEAFIGREANRSAFLRRAAFRLHHHARLYVPLAFQTPSGRGGPTG